jgi:hypothetical protein
VTSSRARGSRRGHQRAAHLRAIDRQDRAHRGEEQAVLAAEIVEGQRGRDPGAPCDLTHGHVKAAGGADLVDRGLDKVLAARGLDASCHLDTSVSSVLPWID